MIRLFNLILIGVLLAACSSGKRVDVERPPTPQAAASSPTTPIKIEPAGAAGLPEVREAIKRVFKDAVVLDPRRTLSRPGNHPLEYCSRPFAGYQLYLWLCGCTDTFRSQTARMCARRSTALQWSRFLVARRYLSPGNRTKWQRQDQFVADSMWTAGARRGRDQVAR